jgi:VPDSG-CTERM motif
MKTNHSFLGGVAGLALVLAFGSDAFGLTIGINRTGGYYSTSGGQAGGVGGGEFTITGQPTLTANYDPVATLSGGFQTFCLEYNEHVGVPATYNASISGGAISGGIGAVNGTDLISMGTAYLYSQFAAGTLVGYDYTVGALRAASAGALQAAFWFLEQEITLGDALIAANPFLGLLGITTSTDADIAAQRADSNGAYDVAVLNLGTSPGYPNQDQLVIARPGQSVPDGGTTLLLMGVALGGISMIRRKLA